MCSDSISSTQFTLIQDSILHPDNLETGKWVYQKYAAIIAQTIRSHGGSSQDLDDIVQETLQRILTGFWQFSRRKKGSFRAWLRRITRSATMDWFRKNPRLPSLPARPVSQAVAMALVRQYDSEILDIALRKVRLEVNPAHWDMFEKVRLQGRNAVEIAEAHGVTAYAVYKAGYRVAARMREILDDLDGVGSRS